MPGAIGDKPSEGAAPAIDLTKYVPKEEHEKVLSTSKSTTEKLQKELDDAKLSLLDPDYIAYIEERQGKVAKAITKVEGKIEDGGSSEELKALRDELKGMRQWQENVAAVMELQAVERKYKDFEDFRDNTVKVLEASRTPLTIEQAYLIAKQQIIEEKTPAEKEKAAKAGSEKPSATVPSGTLEVTKFKDKVSAAEDAWDKVVGSGKDIL